MGGGKSKPAGAGAGASSPREFDSKPLLQDDLVPRAPAPRQPVRPAAPPPPPVPQPVAINLIACSEVSLPTLRDDVVLRRTKAGLLQYYVNGELRHADVRKMFFDPYWCFLRFPDLGRGGKLMRGERLPGVLGRVSGVVAGTKCDMWMPEDVTIEADIPLGLQRGQRVKALEDIYVGGETLAVTRGTRGVVVGVVHVKQKGPRRVAADSAAAAAAAGPSEKRINVKWDTRVDGGTKRISILPDEGKLVTDLPPGGWLRGARVLLLDSPSLVSPDTGTIVGPPHSVHADGEAVRVCWDKTNKDEDISIEELQLMTHYCVVREREDGGAAAAVRAY